MRIRVFESLDERIALTAAPMVDSVLIGSTAWTSGFLNRLASDGLGNGGYAIPAGSTAQSDPLPWDNVDQVMIRFTEDVDVDSSDLSISGINATVHELDDFFYDAQSKTATWTFANAMAIDKTMLDLNGDNLSPIVDLDNNLLDGNWTDDVSVFPSGNGTAGGDFEFAVNYLPGDVDQSGYVDNADLALVSAHLWLTSTHTNYNPIYDINGDGVMYQDDFWLTVQYGSSILPLGDPAGMNNDAPSTQGFDLLSITNDNATYNVSLHDAFEDSEDGNSLTYTIESVSDPALFDILQINQSTGNLQVSSANGNFGRGTIVVAAMDSGGITNSSTVTVDALVTNQLPYLDMTISPIGSSWEISGSVTDADDNPSGWHVQLTGLITERVTLDANGEFTLVKSFPTGTSGSISGSTSDPHGAPSNQRVVYIH